MQVHVHYSSSFPSHSPFFEGSPYKRPPVKEVTVPKGYSAVLSATSLPATPSMTPPFLTTASFLRLAQSFAPPTQSTSQPLPKTPSTPATQASQPMEENGLEQQVKALPESSSTPGTQASQPGLEQQIKALRDHANHLEQMLENRVLKGQIEALKKENEALQRKCQDLESEKQLHEECKRELETHSN